ncbi:hypothetical protein LCGC14_0016230 [marine sediment metagenome]|uniref:4Fe-4S ferredoxin-type domain-containing protein n=1 Tax=marine sediment metagenome TaxID=412755 RepID=A0A0F9YG25_9ZZZZ
MYDTKAIMRKAFRISKVRNESAIRIRVPGGHLDAAHLSVIRELAETFGNGTVHLTTRQGYEIPGVKLTDLGAISRHMAEMIADIEVACGVVLESPEDGYPAAGTRNVCACIGNRVCRFANFDTTALARKIEQAIYPNHTHLKVAITGCPNDCIKAHLHDIGIVGTVVPEYDPSRCIGCEACLDNCKKKITNALSFEDFAITRDEDYCLRCGECILKCPTGAFSRGKKLYRILLGGRTGKRNPRLAQTFVENATQDIVLGICRNLHRFIATYIDQSKAKEHMGYIIDRTGFDTFKSFVLEGLTLGPDVKVVQPTNPGYVYPRRP